MDTKKLSMAPSSSLLLDDVTTRKSRYKKLKKPNQFKMHVCAVCGTTKNLLRCSRCKIIYYCGTTHQYMDWPKHKLQCNKQNQQQTTQQQQTQQLMVELNENYNAIQLSSPPNIVTTTEIAAAIITTTTSAAPAATATTAAATTIIHSSPTLSSIPDLPHDTQLTSAFGVASALSSVSLSPLTSPLPSPLPSPSSLDFLRLDTIENEMLFNEAVETLIEPMSDMSAHSTSPLEQTYVTVTETMTTTTITTEPTNLMGIYNDDINNLAYASSILPQYRNCQSSDLFIAQHQQELQLQQQQEYQQQQQQQQLHEEQNEQQHEPHDEQFSSPTNNHSKSVEYLSTTQFSTHAINQREKSTSHQIDANIANGLLTESSNERRYEELCRNITNDMNEYGLSVVDDFLGTEKGIQILNEVQRMYSAGVFKDGQLVNKVKSEQDLRTIRGDKITWVKGVELGCSNIGYLINQIDAVICRANTMKNNGKLGDYVIKERTKAMVACYPGSGAHYVMHVDNPNKDGRVITAIYYLNINWDAERSGGVLRIFPEQTKSVADIEPKFDRLIFFWSDKRNPHEVQPAHRTRYAITVWYFDANEREAALNRCKNLTTNSTMMFGQL